MDNLTHSLFALTLAQTPMRRAGRGVTLALVLASSAPDSDLIVALTRGRVAYLTAHRGSSHGPIGAAALALATAAIVYAAMRWQQRRASNGNSPPVSGPPYASFRSLVGIALVGTLGHVAMDLATPYGTRLLSPFGHSWYALDWLPIVDVYLLAILMGGLVAVSLKPGLRAQIAAVALLLVVANYGLRAGLHATALRRAVSDGAHTGGTLSSWPDAPTPKLPSDYRCRQAPCTVMTAALPTFGMRSPFRWRIVREYSNGYRLSDIDLIERQEYPLVWLPHDAGPLIELARAVPVSQAFLAFSRFPVARADPVDRDTIVGMQDVRFIRALTAGAPQLRPGLFRVSVRIDPRGTIVDYRFGN